MSGKLTGIGQSQNLGGAMGDTLRVSMTKVALQGDPFDRVERHRSHGTDIHAHGASDADVFPYLHHPIRLWPMERTCRADLHAGWVLAVHAGYRDILALSQSDYLDAASPGVAHLVVVKGTEQLTDSAAAANTLGVLQVFEIAYPLFAHPILPTQNITNSLYPYRGVRRSAG